MERRKAIKRNIDKRLSEIYKSKTIKGEPFFVNRNGVPFRVCTLSPNLIVAEYADTWEDGDTFNTDEMTEEEIFSALKKEIDD